MAEVRLLDLEQAGRAGTARYGYFLNDKVAWPLQKPDGQLITQQHDRALLHTTLADCQSAGVRQPSTPAQASMRPSMCPSTPRWGHLVSQLSACSCVFLAGPGFFLPGIRCFTWLVTLNNISRLLVG